MSRVLSVHHVSLLVADTVRALDFYHGILGIPVDDNRPDLGFPGAWLQIGTQQVHLLELAKPAGDGAVTVHGGRDRHIALRVDDLDVFRTRFEERGIDYTLSRSGRHALFCRDFDGNAVELIEQAPGL